MSPLNFHELCARADRQSVSAYSSINEDELNDEAFESSLCYATEQEDG